MEKKIQLPKEAQPWTEVEVLFIDGCKVTVRYSSCLLYTSPSPRD